MRKASIFLWLIIVVFIASSCSNKEYDQASKEASEGISEYIFADQYLVDHPEQAEASQAFELLVQAEAQKIEFDQSDPVEIAIIYPGKQVSDYWRRSVDSLKARLNEIGISYSIDEHFTSVGTEIALQEEEIRIALAKEPDYLIFTMDAKAHQKIIEQIIEQGKTKIVLQNITTPFKKWEGNQPMLYVGFDHKTGSEIIANKYMSYYEGKQKYGVLYFTKGYVSEMRGDTFIEYMDEHSEFELVASYYTEGNREKSRLATLDMLEKTPDIQFIYACSTDVSMGALDALKELNLLGTVTVNGWGGGSMELESIADSELSLTVMRMNDDNGVAMAEAIKLDIVGSSDQIPTVYSGAFVIVDQNTDAAELNQLKSRAFRYSD